jgi:hypothetical protein
MHDVKGAFPPSLHSRAYFHAAATELLVFTKKGLADWFIGGRVYVDPLEFDGHLANNKQEERLCKPFEITYLKQ